MFSKQGRIFFSMKKWKAEKFQSFIEKSSSLSLKISNWRDMINLRLLLSENIE